MDIQETGQEHHHRHDRNPQLDRILNKFDGISISITHFFSEPLSFHLCLGLPKFLYEVFQQNMLFTEFILCPVALLI